MSLKRIVLAGFVTFSVLSSARAETETVQLSSELFAAGKMFLQLEKIKVRIQGQKGQIFTSNGLKRLGISPITEFPVDLDGLADWVTVTLGTIESQNISITLENGGILATVGVAEVGGPAGRATLGGAIHAKNLVARIFLEPRIQAGRFVLVPKANGIALAGSFEAKGGGALIRPIIEKASMSIAQQLTVDQVNAYFSRKEVQDAFSDGFLLFAGFATGEGWERISEMKIDPTGITFKVDR